MANENQNNLTSLTVQLLSAFVSKNTVSSDELAGLIKATRLALTEDLPTPVNDRSPPYTAAVSIRMSLSSPNFLISLIDGRPYRTLKPHLAKHGLTPMTYRERFGLAPTYPMVAPSYSDTRRAVAQRLGLGRKPGAGTSAGSSSSKDATAEPPLDLPAVGAGSRGSAKQETQKARAKGSSTAKPPRRKLSIASPKEPKSFKAALEAAADHLSSNATER